MLHINRVNQSMFVWENQVICPLEVTSFLKPLNNQETNSVLRSLRFFIFSTYWLFLVELVLRWEYGIVQFLSKALELNTIATLWQPMSITELFPSSLWQPRILNPFDIKDKERQGHKKHLGLCKSNKSWNLDLGTKLQDSQKTGYLNKICARNWVPIIE